MDKLPNEIVTEILTYVKDVVTIITSSSLSKNQKKYILGYVNGPDLIMGDLCDNCEKVLGHNDFYIYIDKKNKCYCKECGNLYEIKKYEDLGFKKFCNIFPINIHKTNYDFIRHELYGRDYEYRIDQFKFHIYILLVSGTAKFSMYNFLRKIFFKHGKLGRIVIYDVKCTRDKWQFKKGNYDEISCDAFDFKYKIDKKKQFEIYIPSINHYLDYLE
jgi:hypothetical protein